MKKNPFSGINEFDLDFLLLEPVINMTPLKKSRCVKFHEVSCKGKAITRKLEY